MDKQTLSNYGWLVIVTLILAVMLALATPFGKYVGDAVVSVANGYVGASENAMNDDNIGGLEQQWANKLDPLNPKGTIPDGATYKQGSTTYNTGDSFPETVCNGDIYYYGDYIYIYKTSSNGWAVSIYEKGTDGRYQTTYGAILESINGHQITDMHGTFENCTSLTTAPKIPNSVTSMSFTFNNCNALTTAPKIPSSVTNMSGTFEGCISLTTAPKIPNSVTSLFETFFNCRSLIKAPDIPSSVTDMSRTFNGCTSLNVKPTIPVSVTTPESSIFEGCTQFGY